MTVVVPPGVNFSRTLYIRSPSVPMFTTVAAVSEESSLRESGQCRGPLGREFTDIFLTLDDTISTV